MPLEKLNAFTVDVSDFADKPNAQGLNAAQVKAQFDAAPDEVRQYLNKLIDVLQSVVDGDSGADNIKVTPIIGVAGDTIQAVLTSTKSQIDSKANTNNIFTKSELQSSDDGDSGADKIQATPIASSPGTVQGILEWLKQQIDNVVLNQIPDGSITTAKLSFDPATQNELNDSETLIFMGVY